MTVVRARASLTYPARFHLVAAMNPCPCGHHTGRRERCTCSPTAVRGYTGRVSGPLLDRVDLHVDVPAVSWRELRSRRRGETSEDVRDRVREARQRAARRIVALRGGSGGRGKDRAAVAPPPVNASLTSRELDRICRLDGTGEELVHRAVDRWGLSARGYHRVLRLARTVADLAGSNGVDAAHVAEAVSYRVLDREVS